MKVKSGDIFFANLNPTIGSEQDGIRPVVVVQNDTGNTFSPTIVVIPITSNLSKPMLPTHVTLNNTRGLKYVSIALTEQIRTIDKTRLINKIAHISKDDLEKIKEAIKKNLSIRGLDLF